MGKPKPAAGLSTGLQYIAPLTYLVDPQSHLRYIFFRHVGQQPSGDGVAEVIWSRIAGV
jgi:hypothetical protein